jgi:3-hydroxybutyryl-CoA dehydrogenase
VQERLGIAGSGTIACGLAAVASRHGDALLWARSEASAQRARGSVDRICGRLSGEVNAKHVRVVTDLEELASESTFLVEAVVEDTSAKAAILAELGRVAGEDTVISTTTSSLSVAELAKASGTPERFVGLHVFNPVPRMKLVELAFPAGATPQVRERARALCATLEKTAVEVPDTAGFVVNRLLFPYLFSAVDLLEESGMEPGDIDACMTLGAGHPMGPLALLDYVGLDVAVAIGESIDARIPPRLRDLIAEGALGKKAGRGFYVYE